MKPSLFKKIMPAAALFSVPLLVYALLLLFHFPAPFYRFFSDYSVRLFLLVLALYLAAFSLPGKWRWLAAACLSMALFAMTLSYNWTSGYSSASMIGGMLPYKDGFNYYNGARSILVGQLLSDYTQQAAWRPLLPGFLSTVMLVIGQNLQVILAGLSGLAAFCVFLSGEKLYQSMGRLSAAVYMTLLYFYLQGQIGYPVTELLGLAVGCLALVLLWDAARLRKVNLVLCGLAVLMLAVSIRAGTFVVFPMLILWAGWVWRGQKRFSWAVSGMAAAVVLVSFMLVNSVYGRLMTRADMSTNGNFAYTIYGQVMGGTSFTYAYADLGTSDPAVIYRAAWQEFRQHPWSLAIASVKSYRDLLFPNQLGIFNFRTPGGRTWHDTVLWFGGLALLLWGAWRALRSRESPVSSLLLFAAAGFLLSVPFLPPVDGGARFYASTVPFFFALLANAIANWHANRHAGRSPDLVTAPAERPDGWVRAALAIAALVWVGTVFVPPVTMRASRTPPVERPLCPDGQTPFALQVNAGSYIDIIADNQPCGFAPQICRQDFWENGTERDIDQVYQRLFELVQRSNTATRIIPANDLFNYGFYYYVGDPALLVSGDPAQLLSGCATEIETNKHNIYSIETIVRPGS